MSLPRVIDVSEVRVQTPRTHVCSHKLSWLLLRLCLITLTSPFSPGLSIPQQSGQKANSFLPFFKRAGRQAAVVEYVAAGSRFKVILPKEDKKLTLVLAGIRKSRTLPCHLHPELRSSPRTI